LAWPTRRIMVLTDTHTEHPLRPGWGQQLSGKASKDNSTDGEVKPFLVQ
jgi:hypothetical protein